MSWVVVLPQVGVPGTPFVPPPGVNVEALLAGGFIRPASKDDARPAPRRKVTRKTPEET